MEYVSTSSVSKFSRSNSATPSLSTDVTTFSVPSCVAVIVVTLSQLSIATAFNATGIPAEYATNMSPELMSQS